MRVLVVEDDPALARIIRWSLELEADCDVHLYLSPADVPDDPEHPWDAALIDWMLPGENGCHLARRLRATRPDMRVVIWTAAPWQANEDPTCAGCTILAKPAPMTTIREALGL